MAGGSLHLRWRDKCGAGSGREHQCCHVMCPRRMAAACHVRAQRLRTAPRLLPRRPTQPPGAPWPQTSPKRDGKRDAPVAFWGRAA